MGSSPAAAPNQREKIVRATASLLRRRGYAATGLAEIIAESGAPKGSLYYYFPKGKAQIAAEAVRYAGAKVRETIVGLGADGAGPSDIVRRYGVLLGGWMAQSDFQDGCPIATTLLETAPQDADIAGAGRAAFADWTQALETPLMQAGLAPARARTLARLAMMSFEGALILARVECAQAAILLAADEIAALIDRELAG